MRDFKVLALVVLCGVLGILLTSCDWPVERTLAIEVELQQATATITAEWSPVPGAYEYEFTNARVSGGDACSQSGTSPDTTVTFTCNRSTSSDATMQFAVRTNRQLPDGTIIPGAQWRSKQYTVPMVQDSTPLPPPDSLVIRVAHRRVWIDPTDPSDVHLQYTLAPATYREINYPQGLTETFMYELWVDGQLVKPLGHASQGVTVCAGVENGEVCPVRPFRSG